MSSKPIVFVVDDDHNVRDALCWLFESVALEVEAYASAPEFLAAYDATKAGCLVLDVRMPGTSGLDLQRTLVERNVRIPVIIITGHGDVPTCVQAFEGGAFSFLEKPLNHQQLLDTVQRAIKMDRSRRQATFAKASFEKKIQELTPREREVMDLILEGKVMKKIATELEISVQTCAKHRAQVLKKFDVTNDVELLRSVSVPNGAVLVSPTISHGYR